MSDPLQQPREAARAMMASARCTATEALHATANTAHGRAEEALKTATTQAEIERIRDVFVSSIVNFGSTVFVTRVP